MLVTNHVLAGALIGAVVRNPSAAFAAGVASHFVLDAVPHWGGVHDHDQFMRVAVRDGLTGLAVLTAATLLSAPKDRTAVVAGMTGAALPDLNKPFREFLGRSPFPRAVDRFHSSIQREDSHRLPQEFWTGAALAAGVALLSAYRRR